MTSAPAASANFASLTVVTVANHLTPLGLHPRHEAVRKVAHNRRYDLWSRLQHCFALSFEIGWRDAAGFRRDLRSPIVEKTPQRFFGDRVSLGRRIGVATEGTQSLSTKNSMYQPGGAMLRLLSTMAFSCPAALVKGMSTSR